MQYKEHQKPLCVKDQIENLKEIGLKIENEDDAVDLLNDISYFRLIKAFSLDLKERNSRYYDNVSFEQIKDLYLFNANFRQSLFPQIEKIEVNLRCRIANYFSLKYGVLGYFNTENFNNAKYHKNFLDEANLEIIRNQKSPFVRNFQTNYKDGTIPFYALVELLSFGSLSKFFKNLKPEDKKSIAKCYGVGYTYLESWIESIAFVRNVCAHYGRLYNAKLVKRPKLYNEYSEHGIENDRIFAVMICMKHIINRDKHWIEFVDVIRLLVEKYPEVNVYRMGFPEDWYELLQ